MKRRLKKLTPILIVAAVTLFFLEIGAFAYLKLAHLYPGNGFAAEYSEVTARSSKAETYKNWNVRPHPFFGFVHTFDFSNYFGFDTGEIPKIKDDKQFVIGIFGGSVAEGWGSDLARDGSFTEKLRRAVPALAKKNIVILNFALGAWKQPQQFIAYSYFMDSVDLSINLDGFNEVAFNLGSRFPVEYPVYSDLLFFPNAAAESDLESLKGIVQTRTAMAKLFSKPGLRASSFAYLIWKSYLITSEKRKNDIFAKAQGDAGNSELSSAGNNYYQPKADDVKLAQIGSKNWAKYTALQSQIARANHKYSFFFLQPNQYDPGSKPLSPEERALMDPAQSLGREKFVPDGYRSLKSELARLRSSGVQAFDISDVFKGHPEPLYVDNCCHFSAKGNPLITDRVVQIISAELRRSIR